MSAAPEPPPASNNDIDLYCLECGYNLRGLSGDPRRCPECGHLNPVSLIEVPASEISAQLFRMEAAPAICVVCVLFLSANAAFTLWIGSVHSRLALGNVCCGGLSFIVPLLVWGVSAWQFRESCSGKPGWRSAFWKYHCEALLVCGLLVLGVSPGSLVIFLGSRRTPVVVTVLAYLSCYAATALIVWRFGPAAHARAKEEIRRLQREAAVNIARERLRSTLYTPHSGEAS